MVRGSIARVPSRGRRELTFWWRVGVALVGAALHACFRMRVSGIDHVPTRGPAIVAGNHLSALDGVILAQIIGSRRERITRFLVAAEFFGRRRLAWALRLYRQIPLRRGQGDEGALDEALRTIRAGALAGILPEGKVNPDPDAGLQRGKRGVARIALAAGAPVIPVGIWGPQGRWPRDGLRLDRPWRLPLAISFGPPIQPHGDPVSSADLQAFTDLVMTEIGKRVDEARRVVGSGL